MSASGGLFHSVAVTAEGVCFTWGGGDVGQLGLGPDILSTEVPLPMPSLCDTAIASVRCGTRHTMLIARDGALWTCGSGEYNQNGHVGLVKLFTPMMVPLSHKTIAVSGGWSHLVIATGSCVNPYTLWANEVTHVSQPPMHLLVCSLQLRCCLFLCVLHCGLSRGEGGGGGGDM